jgi:hypothetical protein
MELSPLWPLPTKFVSGNVYLKMNEIQISKGETIPKWELNL